MGDFGSDSDDSDGEGGMGNVTRIIMRPPGHSGKAKKGHLCFDASFETGNLGRVDLVSEFEYDLFIRPDTCSPRHKFWFNFTVDNVKQDQRVIFNIVNMCKTRNLFHENMTPLVKSVSRPKWQRIPKRFVFYHRSQHHNGNLVLSFAFGFDRDDDVYHFALNYPYSFSRLQSYLTVLERKAVMIPGQFIRETLAQTVQKRPVDLLTFGYMNRESKSKNQKRRIVVIIARVHGGEAPSSLVCQGIVEMLVSSHPIAKVLREYVIIKIVPMLNPDGVFLGNYRSNLLGFDMNRTWHQINCWSHPAATILQETLQILDKSKDFQVDFVVDLHAHTSLKGCFIYGNTYEDVYRCERHAVFPKLLATKADDYNLPCMFFNADINKRGTARRHFCSAINDRVNSYSFEVSLFGYEMPETKTFIPYTEDSYMRCGRNLLRAFLEYYRLVEVIPLSVIDELMPKKKRRAKSHHSRSLTKNAMRVRPKTTREHARLHYTDLNINYDSSTSCDESPYSYRNYYYTPRSRHKKDDKKRELLQEFSSPPPPIIDVPPQPSLTIIDFNSIAIGSLEEATKKSKYKFNKSDRDKDSH